MPDTGRDAKIQPTQSPTSLIAGTVGLAAFVIAVVAGFAAGAAPVTILWRATTAMIVCYVVGVCVGVMGMAAVREYITKYAADRPLPEVPELPKELTKPFAEAA